MLFGLLLTLAGHQVYTASMTPAPPEVKNELVDWWAWTRNDLQSPFKRAARLDCALRFKIWEASKSYRQILITKLTGDLFIKHQMFYHSVSLEQLPGMLKKQHLKLVGILVERNEDSFNVRYLSSVSQLPSCVTNLKPRWFDAQLTMPLMPQPAPWHLRLVYEKVHDAVQFTPLAFTTTNPEHPFGPNLLNWQALHSLGYTLIAQLDSEAILSEPIKSTTAGDGPDGSNLVWYHLHVPTAIQPAVVRLVQWEAEAGLHGFKGMMQASGSNHLFISLSQTAAGQQEEEMGNYLSRWALLGVLKLPPILPPVFSRMLNGKVILKHASAIEAMRAHALCTDPIMIADSVDRLTMANLSHRIRMTFTSPSRLPLWTSLLFVHAHPDYSSLIQFTRFSYAEKEIEWVMRVLPDQTSLANLIRHLRWLSNWMGLEPAESPAILLLSTDAKALSKLEHLPLDLPELLTCSLPGPITAADLGEYLQSMHRNRDLLPRFHHHTAFLFNASVDTWSIQDYLSLDRLDGALINAPPRAAADPHRPVLMLVGSTPNSIHATLTQTMENRKVKLLRNSSRRLLNNPNPLARALYALYYFTTRFDWLRAKDIVYLMDLDLGDRLLALDTNMEPFATWLTSIRSCPATIVYSSTKGI